MVGQPLVQVFQACSVSDDFDELAPYKTICRDQPLAKPHATLQYFMPTAYHKARGPYREAALLLMKEGGLASAMCPLHFVSPEKSAAVEPTVSRLIAREGSRRDGDDDHVSASMAKQTCKLAGLFQHRDCRLDDVYD